jgi:putative molybdopterin biosynthesis protein
MGRNSIETFPARLRELRALKGLSRDQLAVAAGTSSHSIAKLEQGMRAPSLELAWRIADALSCSLDALVKPPSSGTKADNKRPRGRPRKGA